MAAIIAGIYPCMKLLRFLYNTPYCIKINMRYNEAVLKNNP
nr:MAG TPA: hypothetical protein [Caudoviricetes sp.]